MPHLWNISKTATLEAKFDGIPHVFKPEEKKKIFLPDLVNHLVYKLAPKGLVMVPDDEKDADKITALYLAGLRRRRSMLHDVIVQFQTANNERKAAQKGQIEPSPYEIECVKEIKAIDAEIKNLTQASKADVDLVNEYLQTEGTSKDVDDAMSRVALGKSGKIEASGPQFSTEIEDDDEKGTPEEAQKPAAKRNRTQRANAS